MRRDTRWAVLLMIGVLPLACGQPTSRLNAPPQGDTSNPNQMQPFFASQADNAAASDLSIGDVHFVPHTTELNSLGTARLCRIAKVIEPYGGTVRYATPLQDDAMISQRIAHVREYLDTTGIDMSRVKVEVAIAGSNTTEAAEAIEAKARGMEAGRDTGEGDEESTTSD